jgi:hypothetical protein
MDSFEQAAAAAALEKFASDLLTWAKQPQRDGLPDGWRAAYQDRLNEVAAPVRRAFAEDRQALAKLREVESEARDFIGILAANPAIAGKPVSEWEVVAFRESFERLAAGQRWFEDRVRVLDAEDARQRGRRPSREDAAGIDRNSKAVTIARELLSEFARIETFASKAAAAFADAPQPSPEKPADTQPGSTPSASAAEAAAAQGTPGADGDSGDRTEVTAKALAVHCGCSPKKIRDLLKNHPARIGGRGVRLWQFGEVLETLRAWSAEHRVKGLRVLWPEQAAGLRKRRR